MKNAFVSSLKVWLFSSLLLGGLYPLTVTIVGKIFFPNQVNGSLYLDQNGGVRGSYLIAQKHEDPKYFWPRPSAIDYNASTSGATNFSLTRKEINKAAFTSASGLDPHVSPDSAFAQIERISKARSIAQEEVKKLIEKNIQDRDWSVFGEQTVNVMKLNIELDAFAAK